MSEPQTVTWKRQVHAPHVCEWSVEMSRTTEKQYFLENKSRHKNILLQKIL